MTSLTTLSSGINSSSSAGGLPQPPISLFPLGLNLEDDIVAEALIESKEFMLAHAEEEFELAC
jgi:hypothetical protein